MEDTRFLTPEGGFRSWLNGLYTYSVAQSSKRWRPPSKVYRCRGRPWNWRNLRGSFLTNRFDEDLRIGEEDLELYSRISWTCLLGVFGVYPPFSFSYLLDNFNKQRSVRKGLYRDFSVLRTSLRNRGRRGDSLSNISGCHVLHPIILPNKGPSWSLLWLVLLSICPVFFMEFV